MDVVIDYGRIEAVLKQAADEGIINKKESVNLLTE